MRIYNVALDANSVRSIFLGNDGPVASPPLISMPGAITVSMPAAAAPGSVSLNASVSDDGLPNPPGAVTVTWSLLAGPQNGIASFTNAHAASTSAGFNRVGTYVLRLHADDGNQTADANLAVTVLIDPRADFDKSGNVDGSDFLIWQRSYNHGAPGTGAPIIDSNFSDPNYAHSHGDANGDRKVDGTDFLIWQQDYVFSH